MLFRTDNRASGKILISCLTNSVSKDHIAEIFGVYGKINCIEIVTPEKSSGKAVYQRMTVEYETTCEAHKAVKYMNGGMCDCISSIHVYKYTENNFLFSAVNILALVRSGFFSNTLLFVSFASISG